jgi:hypothetical protein
MLIGEKLGENDDVLGTEARLRHSIFSIREYRIALASAGPMVEAAGLRSASD